MRYVEYLPRDTDQTYVARRTLMQGRRLASWNLVHSTTESSGDREERERGREVEGVWEGALESGDD